LGVYLDGTDVSDVAIEGSVTRRLNRPSLASIKIPMDEAIGGAGSRLKVYIDGPLMFHGFVLDCETDSGEDDGYTVYNAVDPMELWQWRPARDNDGDFSNPTFIADFITGPEIMEEILINSESAGTGPPVDAEGTLFLDLGTFETGGQDLTGAPTDWPMSIAQIASLLISSGSLDLVITPTDPGGGIMGTVDGYNGDYGTDLSGSVVFSYGTGALNVRRMRWNEDMSNVCNKLFYFGGPRVKSVQDPEGLQHWCWNIQGDDGDLYGNINNKFGALSGGPFADPGPGGALTTSASYIAPGLLGVLREASQAAYGVRMDIKIYDAASDICLGKGGVDIERWLYRRLWQAEHWIRCTPRELIHVTPIRGTEIGTFDIGDLVGVEAGSQVRGGFSGAQRVYGYTISWDEDGPFELSELQTSPNNDGFV
jgi:hypothetical protein